MIRPVQAINTLSATVVLLARGLVTVELATYMNVAEALGKNRVQSQANRLRTPFFLFVFRHILSAMPRKPRIDAVCNAACHTP